MSAGTTGSSRTLCPPPTSSARHRSIAGSLLVQEPRHVPPDRQEEDECLLAVHHDAAEVLIAHGRETPQPRGVLVERVERPAREDECQAEEGRRDEAGAEIRERRRRREPAG